MFEQSSPLAVSPQMQDEVQPARLDIDKKYKGCYEVYLLPAFRQRMQDCCI